MTLAYSPPSGSSFALGKTAAVTTTATNSASNVKLQCTFDVTIHDTEPPKFECPPKLERKDDLELIMDVKATDNSGEAPTVKTSLSEPVQTASGKVTKVTTTATDGAGNTFECVYNTVLKRVSEGEANKSLLKTRSSGRALGL